MSGDHESAGAAATPGNSELGLLSGDLESAGAAATYRNAKLTPVGGLDISNAHTNKGVKKGKLDVVSTTNTVTVSSDPDSLGSSLLSGLTEPGWKDAIHDALLKSESLIKLALFLELERLLGRTILPPPKEIFSPLNLGPLDTVKVVIVGHDPYNWPGQGHGLAFSMRKGITASPSLQNIFKELIDDVGISVPKHGNLECWARQGVLLLDTVLTVRESEFNSYAGKGWEEVTDTIIREVSARNQ